MPNLSIIPVAWTGAPVVGPSVSVLHCAAGDEAGAVTAFRAFFNSVASILATGVQITFPTAGQTIDEASGVVNGVWTVGAVSAVNGSGGAAFTNGVGMRVKWLTIGITSGRKVTGSTFLVPISNPNFEGAGNITAAALSVVSAAATTLVAVPNALRIYSRKNSDHVGISFPVLGAVTPDQVSWLRSRRT